MASRRRKKEVKVNKPTLEASNLRDIALRIGTQFAAITQEFLPVVGEAIVRSDREISFGCTIKLRRRKNDRLVICKIVAHEPKIPTHQIDDIHFILERASEGTQLTFLWPGTLKEMNEELQNRDEKPEPEPGDDYDPAAQWSNPPGE